MNASNPYEPPASIQQPEGSLIGSIAYRIPFGLVLGLIAGLIVFLLKKFDGSDYYLSLLKHVGWGGMVGNLLAVFVQFVHLIFSNVRKYLETP